MPINEASLKLQRSMRLMADDYVDAQTVALTAQWSRAWQELEQEWVDVANNITARGRPTPAQIASLNRVQRALTITGKKLSDLSSALAEDIRGALEQVTKQTAVMSNEIAAAQMPPVNDRLLPSFTRVDEEAMEQIINRTLGNITAASKPLSEDSLNAVRDALIRAVPSGWSPDRASREILRRVRSGFNGGLARALTIARTEMLDAHRAANRAQNTANPMVKAVVWHAELGPRTCPSCIAKHGTEYPPETPGPYDHPNGRCTFIPRTMTWKEMGFDIEEPSDDFVAAEDWIENEPHAAVAAMGPERYRLYQDGQITLGDMSTRKENPDWRPSYVATPLTELRKKVAS